jgi:hypothetical protein
MNGTKNNAKEIYNAKLSISFTSQLKGRLYLFLTYPKQFLGDHLSHLLSLCASFAFPIRA